MSTPESVYPGIDTHTSLRPLPDVKEERQRPEILCPDCDVLISRSGRWGQNDYFPCVSCRGSFIRQPGGEIIQYEVEL